MIRLEVDNSKKWIIAGLAALALGGFLISLLSKRAVIIVPVAPEKITYSYEMPRGDFNEQRFDLSGRTVIRRYPQQPQQQTVVPVAAKPAVAVKGKAVAKVDPKKAAKEKAEKAKKQAAAAARKKMKVDLVNTARTRSGLSPDAAQTPTAPAPVQSGYYYPTATTSAAPLDPPDKKDDDDLDISTWQSLLQAHPTAENIAKFMRARNAGKVADAGFYRIVTALIQDGADDRRRAGIQILDQDTSPKTYEFIVLMTPKMNAEAQAQLKTLQAKYSTPAKVFQLGRVLATTQSNVVLLAALTQLTQAVGNSSQGGGSGQPSGGSIMVQLTAMSSVLAKVAQNPDTAVAQQAKNLLSLLPKT